MIWLHIWTSFRQLEVPPPQKKKTKKKNTISFDHNKVKAI